ncbi:MAG: hypothetical protein RIS70_4273 [Planctomycetota bacterium]
MATRRGDPGISFDHGAQYFTARDPHFQRCVQAWIEQGIVAEWTGAIAEIDAGEAAPPQVRAKLDQPQRFVAIPGMTAIARHLAADLPLQLDTRIARASLDGGSWKLLDEAGRQHGPFDQLVVSFPAPQSATLLADHPFAPEIQAVAMTPCWTVMAAFTQPISAAWDGAFVHHSSLGWVARNSSKPGRNASAECWVFQATAAWSTAHLETPRAEIPALLLAEFQRLVGSELPPTTYLEAHRWMYSATATQSEKNTISEQRVLFDPARKLAVCGDWICGGRVEGAFLSGLAAADAASA